MENEQFKLVCSIAKAYQRHDLRAPEAPPRLYISGIATGTKLDLDGERMARSVILMFQDAINKGITLHDGRWSRIPLTSEHRDNPRGEPQWDQILGYVVSATVDADWNLWIEAELDSDNATAVQLYRKLTKSPEVGKPLKLGFSIGGKVLDAGTERDEETGIVAYTYRSVALRHITVTSAPSYDQPTNYLEALSKSVKWESLNKEHTEMEDQTTVNAEQAIEEAVIEQDVDKAVAEDAGVEAEVVEQTPAVTAEAEVAKDIEGETEAEEAVEKTVAADGEPAPIEQTEASADPFLEVRSTLEDFARQLAEVTAVVKALSANDIKAEAEGEEIVKAVDVEEVLEPAEEAVVADPHAAVEEVETVTRSIDVEALIEAAVAKAVVAAQTPLIQTIEKQVSDLAAKLDAYGNEEVDKSISVTRGNALTKSLMGDVDENAWMENIKAAEDGESAIKASLGI